MLNKDVQILINSKIDGAVKGLNTVSKKSYQLGRDMERMGTRLGSVFDPAMRTLVAGFAAATAAAAALAKAALSVGGAFEQQMTLVKNVAGATAGEFDALTKKARELGRDLPITADEAAKAMYELASAGLSVQEILSSIDGIIAISIGQNYDLAESASLVVSTMRGFGLEAAETGRIVDVFTNAANASQLTMAKLSNSMTYVAPLAKALGISLEEATAAMAVLSDTGMEASQIGTSLRRVLSSLADPTGASGKAIKKMGVEIYDAGGQMRKLADIMRDFNAAGLTAQQALAIFGDRGAVAALQLSAMANSMDEYQEKLTQVGTTQAQLQELMGAWTNISRAVKSAFDNLLITVFGQLKDKAGDVANSLRELINTLNDWAEQTGVLGESIQAFFSGLSGGLPTLKDFTAALDRIDVQAVVEKFRDFGESIRTLVTSLANIVTKVPWEAIIANLESITKFVLYGWIAGKGLKLGGGILLLIAAFTRFGGSVQAADKVIRASRTASILGGITNAAKGLVGILTSPAGLIASLIVLAGAYGYHKAKSSEYLQEVQENNRKLAEEIAKTDEFIRESISSEKDEVIELPELKGMDALIQKAKDTGIALQRMWSDTSSRVRDTVIIMGDDIAKVLQTKGKAGVEELKAAFSTLPGDLGDIMYHVVDMVNDSLAEVGQAAQNPMDALLSDLPDAVAEVTLKVEQFRDKAQMAMRYFGVSAEDAAETFKESVIKEAENAADGLVEKFQDPQLRNVFIRVLERMGKESGQALYTQIARAMEQVDEEVMSLEDRIAAMLERISEEQPSGEWEATVIREDQEKSVVQLTDGVRFLFETVERASGQAEKALSWTDAIDFDGLSSRAQLSLDSIGGHSKLVGNTVGNNLYNSILDAVTRAVNESKKKLSELTVNVKVRSTSSFNENMLLTDSMRGEL